jgi:hypothetical protein
MFVSVPPTSPPLSFPFDVTLPPSPGLFRGQKVDLQIRGGLTIFVGPNAAGKTTILKGVRERFREIFRPKKVVYLAAGRASAFEGFRSTSLTPHLDTQPAALGNRGWSDSWAEYEGAPGMFMRLKARPDLLLKVEARLQTLHQRRLRLEWTQAGLTIGFAPTTGGEVYFANVEASGLLQLVPLLAALYDYDISALIIDEPEISLHPQLQAFLLQEIVNVSGYPTEVGNQKLIVMATHSPSMVPLRRISDLRSLVFFADRETSPSQIDMEAGELKNKKLSALIARLSENHKLALFARNILLVEGASDEIVVSGVARSLEHPILGANTQIVPVTGKGQFPETAKLFRLMSKKVFVLGDLDLLVDDSQIMATFMVEAGPLVHKLGAENLPALDRPIRNSLYEFVDKHWDSVATAAMSHRYWASRESEDLNDAKAKRRATVAFLLAANVHNMMQLPNGEMLHGLRHRFDALLEVLADAGCVVLRNGTIEDYYQDASPQQTGKPDAAANEVEGFDGVSATQLRVRYSEIVKAIELSAPIRRINENELLREQLGSLLGAAFQLVTVSMTDEELNSRAVANFISDKPAFSFSNKSVRDENDTTKKLIQVAISSPLFPRSNFPFVIGEGDNITSVILTKLP